MLSAGLLRERVTWLSAETRQSGIGEQESEWAPVLTTWAQVRREGGRRDATCGDVELTERIRVTARWRRELHDRMRLRWSGRTYAIDAFIPSEADGSLSVTATKID